MATYDIEVADDSQCRYSIRPRGFASTISSLTLRPTNYAVTDTRFDWGGSPWTSSSCWSSAEISSFPADVEAGVNTAISKIRHVLSDSLGAPAFVETVPGKGISLVRANVLSAMELSAQALIYKGPCLTEALKVIEGRANRP
jgi:hypothetical protein